MENKKLIDGGSSNQSPQSNSCQLIIVILGIFGLAVMFGVLFVFLPSFVEEVAKEPSDPWGRALFILDHNPLVDGHNDVPWEYRLRFEDNVYNTDFNSIPALQTDIERLKKGKVGAQFWSVYIPCESQGKDAVRLTLEQIDVVYKLIDKYPDTFAFAGNGDDIRRNFNNKKISSLIGIEGGHQIDASLGALRMMFNLGARYMTLTHTCNNEIADSERNGCAEDIDCRAGICFNNTCTAPQTEGVTDFGKKVIAEMNRLGMLIDISHVSHIAMDVVFSTTEAPVIFSHSAAYTLCNNTRNVPDDMLLRLKDNGGVLMVVFINRFITCDVNATMSDVLDHIDYIVKGKCSEKFKDQCGASNFKGIGVNHVGLGSDFDGGYGFNWFPTGLRDVSYFTNFTMGLIERNYTSAEVAKIVSGNLLRVFDQTVRVAADIRNREDPQEEVIYPNRTCRSQKLEDI